MREASSENPVDAELQKRYEQTLKKLAEKELEAAILKDLLKKQKSEAAHNKRKFDGL